MGMIKRQKSMTSLISIMEVLLAFMAALVIVVMVYAVTMQNRLQIQFMNRMENGDQILEDLYDMEREFREFGHSWTENEYRDYMECSKILERDLEKYRVLSADAPETQNCIRRLNNFNIYQAQQLKEAREKVEERYYTYIYIVNGLDGHQKEALAMVRKDVEFAREAYEHGAKSMAQKMFLIAGIFGVSAVVMSAVLARFSAVTRRALHNMTEYFNHLAASEWNTPDLQSSAYQELSLIAQTANRMKEEIRKSILEIQNRAMLEKQLAVERLENEKQRRMVITAQMSALRAQVNPHFLFNSLNMIGVTALVGDSKMVMQMVEATGKILRYSLYHQEPMTSLEEELEIVQQYLFLQKCRFEDAVRSEIHNELEGEEIEIPVMSIQPIVENCFKHGFGNKKNLNVHITIGQEAENLVICVMDDGMGFSPQQVLNGKNQGIGLENIRKRLELMYGKQQSQLEIESVQGEYTCVSLKIPKKEVKHESADRGR